MAQLSWHIELTIPDSTPSSLKLQSQSAVESFCSPPSLLIFRTLFLGSSKKVLSPLCTTLVWVGLSWSLQGTSSPVQPPQALSPLPGTPTAQPTAHLGKARWPSSCIWTPSTPLKCHPLEVMSRSPAALAPSGSASSLLKFSFPACCRGRVRWLRARSLKNESPFFSLKKFVKMCIYCTR